MKSLITLSMILASSISISETTLPDGDKCLKKVKKHYYLNGNPSDYPVKIRFEKLLPAGEALKGYNEQEIAKYNEDKLLYIISGSYHSGYFTDLSVANVNNCQTEEIINLYSE